MKIESLIRGCICICCILGVGRYDLELGFLGRYKIISLLGLIFKINYCSP